ncbi:MAG: diaminopimelate decarboxylase [Actinomycetes bacterium]
MTIDPELLSLFPENTTQASDGALMVGGVRLSELAESYGTPALVVDEDTLRAQARLYREGLVHRRPGSSVAFASKSFPCSAVYRVMAEEGLHVDVAGAGELIMALKAGVRPERIVLHGNAKTQDELHLAVDAGVGTVVVDGWDDLRRLSDIGGPKQRVLLRVIPGVDAPTMAAISTGHHGSKFGMPLEEATRAIDEIQEDGRFELLGLHLHIGSQICSVEVFTEAVTAVSRLGEFAVYDIGGGLGVRYRRGDVVATVEQYLDAICEAASGYLPSTASLWIEPGRSLVARAGLTLYRVVTVKRGDPTFVAVDGGIADNFEASTYVGTRFDAVLADRPFDGPPVELVGRQCESGDLFASGLPLEDPQPGDVVAMPMTGAYTYTLWNNYNGALRPPVVFIADGEPRLVVRRETYEELTIRDV